jgi:hypothetical protein
MVIADEHYTSLGALHERISGIENTIEQRFNSIDIQLRTAEAWRREQKADQLCLFRDALDVAKEAVNKSELAVSAQLDRLTTTLTSQIEAVDHSLTDQKERLLLIESRRTNLLEIQNEHDSRGKIRSSWLGATAAAASAVLGMVVVIVSLAATGVIK